MDFRKRSLIKFEKESLKHWLLKFETSIGREPYVKIGDSYQTMMIKNFPLPSTYTPDYIQDLILIIDKFPISPPIGLYIYKKNIDVKLEEHIKQKLNVFNGKNTYHDAPKLKSDNFIWVCFGYLDGWKYNFEDPARGDNITKMMMNFFSGLI